MLPLRSKPSSASSRAGAKTRFEKLGLFEPKDFLLHFPLRYEDETQIHSVAQARPGASVQLEGEIIDSQVSYHPRRSLSATLRDATGLIHLRWLHFYPSQLAQVQPGKRWRVRGEVRSGFGGLELIHPKLSSSSAPLPTALTPIYPTTEGLSQRSIRQRIEAALDSADLSDTLPKDLRVELGLMAFDVAIQTLHRPPSDIDLGELQNKTHPAWVRVKFDELLAQQLSLTQARASRRQRTASALKPNSERPLVAGLLSILPFDLTSAQRRVVQEIYADLAQAHPMHRLLQGDVGSGKTVVAALAAMRAIENNKQAVVMAPTEILAEQHYVKMQPWAQALGLHCVWLSAGLSAPVKRQALRDIQSGAAKLIIGTQALIQHGVEFHNLGLSIVDEQHRFGVNQRLALSKMAQVEQPHQLSMSATPIPRSLAMTFFADLDVSVIDERPPGRRPVKTKLVSAKRRAELIDGLRHSISQGGQVYWVCPLVEESEALQLQTAEDTFVTLQQALPTARVGLVHGRLSAQEKTNVMQQFKLGHLDVLVATTVIEVGVDVPNATEMVIEHAERFGLAQLHQLRGRVGRGSRDSVCVLLYAAPLSADAKIRLRAMYETDDGFEIAQRDLQLRGPGEFLGARQSGLSLLRFADLDADAHWVSLARDVAQRLQKTDQDTAQCHIERWMSGREDFLNG